MEEKRNIVFLDFDGVLNSERSFYQKFADHHNVEWTDEDFDIKWMGQGNEGNFSPGMMDRIREARDEQKDLPGYKYPNLGMYNWPHEEPAIENLNKIIEENNADVVICSSWRVGKTIEELQGILDGWGFKGKVVGKTPRLEYTQHLTRGKEILEWVMEYHSHIKSICILDDDAQYDINPIFAKWAVQEISGYSHGLREDHIPLANKCFSTPFNPLYDLSNFVNQDMLAKARKIESEKYYRT